MNSSGQTASLEDLNITTVENAKVIVSTSFSYKQLILKRLTRETAFHNL